MPSVRDADRLGGEHFLESGVKGQLDDIVDQLHVWYLVKNTGDTKRYIAHQAPCPSPS